MLQDQAIRISMDGRGAWRDNVFVERLWRSVKYEEVYLREYRTMAALAAGLEAYFWFYCHERPHQALETRAPITPAERFQPAGAEQRELLPLWLPGALASVPPPPATPTRSSIVSGYPASLLARRTSCAADSVRFTAMDSSS